MSSSELQRRSAALSGAESRNLERRKQKESSLSHEFLKSKINYEKSTGIFTWRNGNHSNSPRAGYVENTGYVRIVIGGYRFMAHRLAWFYVNGKWPEFEIDHIDLDKSNNAILNLREAKPSENCMNRKIRIDNQSGFKGVGFDAKSKKWRARIAVNGRRFNLGYFNTAEEAGNAIKKYRKSLHGDFSRSM